MIEILDCTLRDGGYINNWRFSNNFIDNFNKLNDRFIDYVEIGFINKTDKYLNQIIGPSRILDKNQIKRFDTYNFKKVVMADYLDINLSLLQENINIDLVRIAFHKIHLKEAIDMCCKIKKLGYKVSVNAMAVTNYSDKELDYLFEKINKHKLDILYIADSYGSLHQNDIKKYVHLCDINLYNSCKIGFHLHNNMNNAYSNYEYLTNITQKINRTFIVDSTMFGMGRGAGNLQTELVLINKYKTINFKKILQIVQFIQDYIKPFYNKNDNYWGYDLDYLLSGYLKMHPNYIVKMRQLNISMKNRFFLIEKLVEKKVEYTYFNINAINLLIKDYKDALL